MTAAVAMAFAWHSAQRQCEGAALDMAELQERVDVHATVQLTHGMQIARLKDQVEGMLARERK